MSRAKKKPVAELLTEGHVHSAVESIDAAITDIVDSWSMRTGRKPEGNCLMSALTNLRHARDELQPRTGERKNADGSVTS